MAIVFSKQAQEATVAHEIAHALANTYRIVDQMLAWDQIS